MKYDVIVVGGGPGGLMAAKTAAEDGLKVLLVERKKKLAEVNRACLQIFYLRWVCPDEYLEPVSVENTLDGTKFHFHGPGFSVDYKGPLKPYLNAVWVSPSGYRVYPFKNELFGFYYEKESLLAGLLASAEKAGVELMSGTLALGMENTPDGVKVFVRGGNGTKTLEARKAIAADGFMAKMAGTLGLNEERRVYAQLAKGFGYYMTGVEPDIPGHETGWVSVNMPSVPEARVGIGLQTGDLKWVMGSYRSLMKIPRYASWFRNAQLVRTTAFAGTMRSPIREPEAGNVMIIGDAACAEAWIQGAIACGYKAVKAIVKELDGQDGYTEYNAWWQKAFYFHDPGYFKRVTSHHALNLICNDEEVDYIYKLFENERVVPTLEIARNPALIKDDNPALYEKVTKSLDNMIKEIQPVLDTYPPGSAIFREPDAYLGRWQSYNASKEVK